MGSNPKSACLCDLKQVSLLPRVAIDQNLEGRGAKKHVGDCKKNTLGRGNITSKSSFADEEDRG